MSKPSPELLKGSSDLLVLATLEDEALYGYEIAKRLREKSKELFAFGEGMLYPLLHKLEKEGVLESFWQDASGRKRKYYQLTRKGKTVLAARTAEWRAFASAVNAITR